jgi:hypothetical protein
LTILPDFTIEKTSSAIFRRSARFAVYVTSVGRVT